MIMGTTLAALALTHGVAAAFGAVWARRSAISAAVQVLAEAAAAALRAYAADKNGTAGHVQQ